MKLPVPVRVIDLAGQIEIKQIIGDPSTSIKGINEIHKVSSGDLTFVDSEKYLQQVLNSPAKVILLNRPIESSPGKTFLVVDQPFEIYNQLIKKYRPFTPLSAMVSETAVIHPSAILEPNCIIGNHVVIGKNCYIQSNVTIRDYTTLGNRVSIQSGSVIGSDAFYYQKTVEGLKRWRSGGRVVIQDNVDIGASCTICKGVSGDTVIGAGTKLDCQVHIGHGATIGKNCLLAAQVGIGGKTIIGDNVIIYGQVGVAAKLKIGDNVVVLAKSGVTKNLKKNKKYFGYPAGEVGRIYKELAALRFLPKLLKRFNKMAED